jgi:selenocysteine lyase/cysteine desulfurase
MIAETKSVDLENYFRPFRKNIIGYDTTFESPYGRQKLLYADWTASGRLYAPIEKIMTEKFGPFVGNTHTETSITGTLMTYAFHAALEIIKRHVGANANDVIITHGSGMTGVINKFQRILGLRIPEQLAGYFKIPNDEKPVVFVTHMEHHSNHTSWLETIADVECIPPDEKGAVNLNYFEGLLQKYKNRKTKIASVTACSNVTGIQTPYYQMAEMIHRNGGLCFVDFACSAPYVDINMHPLNPLHKLDAIYFSPHKFLGGPGTPGVLVFDSKLYAKKVPDEPGGGTVDWTNPWGGHKFLDKIELREDGGTPPFLQTIKAGLCIKLKEKIGTDNMLKREEEMVWILFQELRKIKNLHILADPMERRLSVLSFYIDGLHYNLGVKLLNDRFGIQVRGGCSCAGTYGHYLLHIDQEVSKKITSKIDTGDLSEKPGWIRISLHPVMTNEELYKITNAVNEVAHQFPSWSSDYEYDPHTNEFKHRHFAYPVQQSILDCFNEID